jgi:branched-chain amino acid transport system ATP-binding protein
MTRLAARGVSFGFGGVCAVDGVDLDAESGAVTAVIGSNGAGKTTLLNCLSGVVTAQRGQVLLGTTDVTRRRADALTRLGLFRTFQTPAVFLSLTVEENLMVAAEQRRRASLVTGLAGLPDPGRRQVAARVEAALAELGLRKLRSVRTANLPTGTLRLVELARAVAGRPAALLLDEPAAGLTDAETERLGGTLRRLAGGDVAIVLVEHDLELVFDIADRVYVMDHGTVTASGPPEQVRASYAAGG